MRTADGWPAVLGLAAMSGDVDFTSSRLMSQTLYDFLASELLAAANRETQDALMLLAVASVTDVERGALRSRHDRRRRDRRRRRPRPDRGHGPQVALAPSPPTGAADSALRGRRRRDSGKRTSRECRRLFELRRWDEALCVAEVAQNAAFATEAIGAALDDLLAAGRTSSLQRWVAAARSAGAEGGLIDYAESEALLRADELDHAIALATQAAGSLDGDLAARAHLVAGTAAHLTDRPDRTELHASLRRNPRRGADDPRGSTVAALSPSRSFSRTLISTSALRTFEPRARSGTKQSLMIATADLSSGRTRRWTSGSAR